MASTSFKDLINSDKPVLIDFHADWCGPCKMQGPILNNLKSAMGDAIKIVKIDVDKNNALASKLGVSSIPTLMIFQNGELKWRGMGVQTQAVLQEQLSEFVEA